jgi:hypothetical protein
MQKTTPRRLFAVLLMLIGATLACNLPSISTPSLPPTARPIPTEELQTLEEQIQATLASPDANGEVSLTLTQAQLNAIITAEVAKQPNQTITDPSVVLKTGQMEVYGKVTQSGISTNAKIVLRPAVDANGDARLNVASIDLGGIPIPDVLKSQVESSADTAINNSLGGSATGLRAKNITINEGQMTLTGIVQR